MCSHNKSRELAGCRLEEVQQKRTARSEMPWRDRVNETVGAMELTEDYYTHRDSCQTHARTHLEHNVCLCVCREITHLHNPSNVEVMHHKWDCKWEKCQPCLWTSCLLIVAIHTLTCTPHQQKCLDSSSNIRPCV